MVRRSLIFLLLVALPSCAGADRPVPATDAATAGDAAAIDAGRADVDLPCPDSPPTTPEAFGEVRCPDELWLQTCTYPNSRCWCGQFWWCRSIACPERPTDAHPGESCTDPGLVCRFQFETRCDCIGPERKWACCAGTFDCPREPPAPGEVCCPLAGPPANLAGPICAYQADGGSDFYRCIDAHWTRLP